MNIVLVGYRCSGKTSVGRLLAKKLNWGFIDTDDLIVQETGLSIDKIVLTYGWKKFREIERLVIKKVSKLDKFVISTGGGVVLSEENVKNLRKNGWLVWLKATPKTIKSRMLKDEQNKRPPLVSNSSSDEIEEVLNSRIPHYKKASDFEVDTDDLTKEEVCELVLKGFLQSLGWALSEGGHHDR